jgi:heme-degrading monooxygenase HmoA
MFARVATVQTSPDKVEAAVNQIREQRGEIQKLKGYKEGQVLFDRKSGKYVTVSFWESEADARAFETAGAQLRQKVAAAGGVSLESVTVEYYEVAPQD